MKLAWIAVSGPSDDKAQALARLGSHRGRLFVSRGRRFQLATPELLGDTR